MCQIRRTNGSPMIVIKTTPLSIRTRIQFFESPFFYDFWLDPITRRKARKETIDKFKLDPYMEVHKHLSVLGSWSACNASSIHRIHRWQIRNESIFIANKRRVNGTGHIDAIAIIKYNKRPRIARSIQIKCCSLFCHRTQCPSFVAPSCTINFVVFFVLIFCSRCTMLINKNYCSFHIHLCFVAWMRWNTLYGDSVMNDE